MLFNSLEYLLFFPVVVLVVFSLPYRWRWLWLLAASYYFYMSWKPIYGILLFATTILDYFIALWMGQTEAPPKRWRLLSISLVTNLGMLFFFKYYDFVAHSTNSVLGGLGASPRLPHLGLELPIGISFYVLQTLSYTIDVFRRRLSPEPHLGIFMLFVSFFPQLVAGPIERAGNLLPQLRKKHDFDEQRAIEGIALILWGLFKKVVIADTLSFFVDPVFANSENYLGSTVLLAAYLFAFQLYCDFSGYSDIAIGSARILGIDLMENFRRPFLAKSIREFWQRWHISLTTWFRDYIYLPLGGSREVRNARANANVFTIFLLSGLWHGAQWTYVIWGVLNGFFYLVGKWLHIPTIPKHAPLRPLATVAGIFLTFNFFAISLIFFRAESLATAIQMVAKLGFIVQHPRISLINGWQYLIYTNYHYTASIFPSLAILMLVEILQEQGVSLRRFFRTLPGWQRWAVCYVAAMVIVTFGTFSKQTIFIYFQF